MYDSILSLLGRLPGQLPNKELGVPRAEGADPLTQFLNGYGHTEMRTCPRVYSAGALSALLLIFLLLLNALFQIAHGSEPALAADELDPAQFESPIDWVEAVDQASTTKGRAGFGRISRGLNSVLTLGLHEAVLRALPDSFRHLQRSEVLLKRFAFKTWTIGPYRKTIEHKELEGRPDLALHDWCNAHEGEFVIQQRNWEKIWTCDRGGIFLAVLHWGYPDGLKTPFLTVMQPIDQSDEQMAHFSKLMLASNLRTASQIKEATNKFVAGIVADDLQMADKARTEGPLRRSIGTQLCQDSRHETGIVYTLVGYVEAKSPDVDKVKINIVRRLARKGTMTFEDRESRVVWDNPDLWYVCQ